MFEVWLHQEMGYTYSGENSFYALTIPELDRLSHGFEKQQEQERDQMEQENPDLRKKRVRESDKRALAEFKQEHNLTNA